MLRREPDRPSSTTAVRDPLARRARSAAHEQLAVFVGTWQVRGHNAPAVPGCTSTRVTGHVTYAWMPGGFFLTCYWARLSDDAEHTGLAVFGWDPAEHAFTARYFDNLGNARIYRGSIDGGVWTFDGTFERARIVFAPDERSFTESWETTRDGVHWAPRCELIATRA